MIGIGSVVNGKYRLVRLLGDGGMGSVYEAQHAMLGTRVAVKMLHPELGRRTGLVERFLQEARVAAQIRSGHVVQVTDVDRTPEGNAYIVMELLEGEPLSAVLDRQRKLAVAVACEYAGQVLEGLEAAHAIGVIHRDLKPENVFVTFASAKPVLKLIDFGIAKARGMDVQARKLTVAGVVMGTAEYMAPEQAHSADKADGRSDVYAVGVMLYEMVAGTRPVSGEDARGIAWKVERGEVVPLVKAAPDAPREVAGLVHRAMAARPELRFATATEMRLALRATLGAMRSPVGHTPARMPAGKTVELAHPPVTATPPVPGAPAFSLSSGAYPDPEPHVDTIRAPPIATALAVSPYTPAPVSRAPLEAGGAAARSSRSRNATLALVAIPLVLGAGAVALVVGTGMCTSSGPTRAGIEAVAVEAGAAPVAAETATAAPQDVPALSPTRAAAGRPASNARAPAPVSGERPQPGAQASGVGVPGVGVPGLPTSLPGVLPSGLPLPEGFPTAFPSALPSGFPTAFPSALPTAFPSALPTAFPGAIPTALPSALPVWPPAPQASAVPSSSARPEDRTY